MVRPWHGFFAMAVLVSLSSGCADVKRSVSDAGAAIDELLGVEPAYRIETPSAESIAEGEALFDQAEVARAQGNLEAAAPLYNRAAELGSPRALTFLGEIYFYGLGVARDTEVGLGYFAQAAAQGHAPAEYQLGEAFMNGDGVARDRAWAVRWYGKAAWQGYPPALYAYGIVYAAGLGLPADEVEATVWITRAAEAGHTQAAEMLPLLTLQLTPAQLAAARTKAADFAPATSPVFADAPTVLFVQLRLHEQGYDPGPADGLMGPRTSAAIRKAERSERLDITGKVTPVLVERLFEVGQG